MRNRRGRRGRGCRRLVGHAARLALGAMLVLVGRSAWAAVPAGHRGSLNCTDDGYATSFEYLTGVACPPSGFAETIGYQPELIYTPHGWRYLKPASAGGRCSGPILNQGPFWNFEVPCQTHDYGYDLVRFGVADRTEIDRLLFSDMMASCRGWGIIRSGACKTLADSARAVLRIGDATGMEPMPVRAGGS